MCVIVICRRDLHVCWCFLYDMTYMCVIVICMTRLSGLLLLFLWHDVHVCWCYLYDATFRFVIVICRRDLHVCWCYLYDMTYMCYCYLYDATFRFVIVICMTRLSGLLLLFVWHDFQVCYCSVYDMTYMRSSSTVSAWLRRPVVAIPLTIFSSSPGRCLAVVPSPGSRARVVVSGTYGQDEIWK